MTYRSDGGRSIYKRLLKNFPPPLTVIFVRNLAQTMSQVHPKVQHLLQHGRTHSLVLYQRLVDPTGPGKHKHLFDQRQYGSYCSSVLDKQQRRPVSATANVYRVAVKAGLFYSATSSKFVQDWNERIVIMAERTKSTKSITLLSECTFLQRWA